MNKALKILCTVFLVGCTTVPITGRRQVSLMNESELVQMSLVQYNDFIATNAVVGDYDEQAQLVKKVGDKIAKACEEFLKENGHADRVKDFNWEFNLVDDPTVNAWCMPGGKVVFYTGILPICEDEEGIAVVMGHEVAHAVARHGNERMSQGMIQEMGNTTLSLAMSQEPETTRALFQTAYGLSSNFGVLAYSRNHESEADKMGLVFMTKAGYNPEVAAEFWTRMSQSGCAAPPEWMSTHPSNERRINDINTYIPVAKSLVK